MILERLRTLTESDGGHDIVRAFLLDLAVRGKLVEQQTQDEPAALLLERIRDIQGKNHKSKPLKTEGFDDSQLPNSWTCAPLKAIASKIGSGATPKGGRESYKSSGIPLVRSQNVRFEGFTDEGLVYIDSDQAARLANVELQTEDVLLNITGASIGRVCICPPRVSGGRVNQHVCILRPVLYLPGMLWIYLSSPSLQRRINGIQLGATRQAITKAQIERFIVPIPPLSEQKRIVARVEELTDLCNHLEKAHQTRNKLRDDFTASALDNLTQAKTPDQLKPAWTIIKNNFPTITATPDSIQQIRQTILQLAVQGKLCPQDPSDAPAKLLIERIASTLPSLAKERGLRRKSLAKLAQDEQPYDLPENWCWSRLGSLGLTQTGTTPKVRDSDDGDMIPFIKPAAVEAIVVPDEKIPESSLGVKGRIAGPDAVLMVCIGGSIGKTGLIKERCTFNQQINSVDSCVLPAEYLAIALRSPFFYSAVLGSATGTTMPIINKGKWASLPVPVPPLKEQHRIVERVAHLMAICDRLEEALKVKNEKAAAFAQSVIAHELAGEETLRGELVGA